MTRAPVTLKQSALYFALSAAALMLLRWADMSLPALGLWLFIALSLTIGMGHGALDAVLLLAQFKPYRRVAAYAFLYLLLVLAAGAALAMSVGWALLALLTMSVWHFGELYRPSLATRLVVGGASVMAPMLLSSKALAAIVQPALGVDYAAAWQVWHWLAITWALGAAAWVLWVGVQHFSGHHASAGNAIGEGGSVTGRALLELAVVLALNAALSPLMAFAVHFGLWHSLGHILRVVRAVAQHAPGNAVSPARLAWAVVLTALATAVLLWLLWQVLPVQQVLGSSGAVAGQAQVNVQSSVLLNVQVVQWLVVALAAVTLPHMLLVAYSHRWLGR